MTKPNVETAVQDIPARGFSVAAQSASSGMRSLSTLEPQSPEAVVDALLNELRAPLVQAVSSAQNLLPDEVRLQSWLAMQARFRLLRLADRFNQELAASAKKNPVPGAKEDAVLSAQTEAPAPAEEFFDPSSVVPSYERTSQAPPPPSRRPPPPEDD